ncbi:hypothetical protein EI94DRAFT_1716488 [Lactarius quietus]|nr:hypothetical protein EI94DRAFT_1716488 [Lactarius quietus]
MAVVTTELKRVFNEAVNRAHNRLHDSVLLLEIQPATEPSLPTIMSTQQSKVANVPRLDINPFKLDKSLLQRLRRLPNEFEDLFEHLKFSILIPLSWFLTMFKFIRSLVWGFLMLPVRLFINFYERRVRQAFPLLPSIWGTLFYLFPEGITFPTFTSLTAGPFRGAGPIGKNPTMDIDLDAIINGTNGEAGGHSDSVGTGSGDPSTQVNINPSTQGLNK